MWKHSSKNKSKTVLEKQSWEKFVNHKPTLKKKLIKIFYKKKSDPRHRENDRRT